MKKRFTIILLVIGVGLSAQTKVDSLFAVWQDQAQPKASRVDAYKDYIWDGFMFSNPDSAFKLAEALFDFANQQDDIRAKAQGLYLQGVSLHLRGGIAKHWPITKTA